MRPREFILHVVLAAAPVGLAALLVTWALAGSGAALDDPARAAFALPLVLVAPGYALTALLFGARPLGAATRALVGIGLSAATLVLLGLVLDRTPFGLTPTTWAVSIGALVVLAGMVAFRRRLRDPAAARTRTRLPRPRPIDVAAVVAALVVAVVALGLARNSAQNAAGEVSYTQLWLLPDRGQPSELEFGATTAGSQTRTFLFEVRNDEDVLFAQRVRLASGRVWQTTVPRRLLREATSRRVHALLIPLDDPAAGTEEVWLTLGEAGRG